MDWTEFGLHGSRIKMKPDKKWLTRFISVIGCFFWYNAQINGMIEKDI